MTIEEAREYWCRRLERAEGYSDEHWDAEERHAHKDYVDAMTHAVTALAICRWIPVEDALPEENVRCIVYMEGGGYGISHRMGRNLEKWDCLGLQVTHWMPFPEPPDNTTDSI